MDFVNRIKTLENKLAAVGNIVEADEAHRILLRCVREEYSIPVQVIRSSGLSLNKALSDLITFEVEAQVKEEMDNEDEGTTALPIKYNKTCKNWGPQVLEGTTPHTTEECFFNPRENNFKPHLVQRLSRKISVEEITISTEGKISVVSRVIARTMENPMDETR